ncbi:hypothetical protein LCGC14_0612840 [marine sediment metagenome]|uniref:Uncharacterized protein n=1 Tax=marine sediment metagenome TaxID=412755 RepID=A0A0F9R7B1_9ZZZZ
MEDTREKQHLAKIDGCVQKLVHIMNQFNDWTGGDAPLAKKPDAIRLLESWSLPRKKDKEAKPL